MEFEVESIQQHRLKEYKRKGRGSKVVRSFFVKWKNFPPEHDEWVTEANMTCNFTLRNTVLDEYCQLHNLPLTVIKSEKVAQPSRPKTKRTKRTGQLANK